MHVWYFTSKCTMHFLASYPFLFGDRDLPQNHCDIDPLQDHIKRFWETDFVSNFLRKSS